MVKWGYVENNIVQEVYETLPKNWQNVSNFWIYHNDVDALRRLSVYQVVDITKDLDPLTEIYGPVEYRFDNQQQIIYKQTPILLRPNPRTQDQLIQKTAFLQTLDSMRVSKLQETDWTQLNDVQAAHDDQWKQQWQSYRANVRAIVTTYSSEPYLDVIDIAQVAWPSLPYPINSQS